MIRRPLADWVVAAEAAVWLAFAGAAIRLLPFSQVMALAGMRAGRRRDRAPPEAMVQSVRWAVTACAERWPGGAACFQRGVAAQIMLRRRGLASTLYFGARTDGVQGPRAHVWVVFKGVDVVGGDLAASYAVLAAAPPEG